MILFTGMMIKFSVLGLLFQPFSLPFYSPHNLRFYKHSERVNKKRENNPVTMNWSMRERTETHKLSFNRTLKS
ncbi:hypothetical protein ACP275_02G096100 [Erythranthe tilingii]